MNSYTQEIVGVESEPKIALTHERYEKSAEPSEEELRYLGNAYNYCGSLIKDLKDCVEDGVQKSDSYLFKKCKRDLENLHHCYNWREPTEFEYNDAFMKETEPCALNRDLYLKCYFRQAAPWEDCHPSFVEIYRCLFRKKPSLFTIH